MKNNLQNLNSDGLLDKTGAAISWLCAAHCLAMPLLFSFLPLLGISFLMDEGVEYIIIGISVVIALISLLPAYFRQHHKLRTLFLFVSGICFVIFADILFEENLLWKLLFVLTGAVLITASHFINRKLCLDCRRCAESECR